MSEGTRRPWFANVAATLALAVSLAGGAAIALDSIQGQGRIFHEQLRIPAGGVDSWDTKPFTIMYHCPSDAFLGAPGQVVFVNNSDKKMTLVADPGGAFVLSPNEGTFLIDTNPEGFRIEFQFSWGAKTGEVPVSGRHSFRPEPGRCFMQGVATIVE